MIEEQIISYLLDKQDWSFIVDNDVDDSYFITNKDQFRYLRNYFDQYKRLPDVATFLGVFNNFEYLTVTESVNYLSDAIKFHKIENDAAEKYNEMRKVLMTDTLDMQSKIDKIASITNNLTNSLAKSQSLVYSDMSELSDLAINTFNERELNPSKNFYRIGINWLDETFLGWDKNNDYVIVAGRPGTGKSMLLCKLAAEQIKQGKKVAFYEGEMSKVQTYERIISSLSGISATDMLLAKQEIKSKYVSFLQHRMPNFRGTINILTPQDIGSKYPTAYQLETFVRKTEADILFVDQLSLMTDLEHAKVPFEKAGNISRQIKSMRDKLNIPVICASQMNRSKNEDNKVGTENIAQSDMISQDATRIIMLTSKRDEEDNTITMTIAKNRTGKSYGNQDFIVDFAKCFFQESFKTDSEGYANEQSLFENAPNGDDYF